MKYISGECEQASKQNITEEERTQINDMIIKIQDEIKRSLETDCLCDKFYKGDKIDNHDTKF